MPYRRSECIFVCATCAASETPSADSVIPALDAAMSVFDYRVWLQYGSDGDIRPYLQNIMNAPKQSTTACLKLQGRKFRKTSTFLGQK